MRHRAARRRRAMALGLTVLIGFGLVVALTFLRPDARPPARAGGGQHAAGASPVLRPTARARPQYLSRTYRAPPSLVRPGGGGTLQIPSLRIEAPVDAVGLDGSAMAVPDDPHRVGWLTGSARAGDLVGASIVAGHVSDRNDRPGALATLLRIRRGAQIVWTDHGGRAHRFRVVELRRYPRKGGLPATLFAADGPHLLRLITCTERISTPGGGFHYRSNLVVTAVG